MKINEPCILSTVDEHGPIYVYQTRTSLILSFNRKVYQSSMKLKNTDAKSDIIFSDLYPPKGMDPKRHT